MHKTLCVAVLLLPTLALTQASKPAPSGAFNSPQIVAKGKFPNQTVAISATIFTPVQTGLYRLSVYATMVTTSTSGAFWSYNLGWTDDAGPQTLNSLLVGEPGITGQFVLFYVPGFQIPEGGPVITFEAKAGQPITHSVTHENGPPDGTAYSLYYTLERLE